VVVHDPTEAATGTVDTSGVMTTAMMVDDAITTTMIVAATDMIDMTDTTALVKTTDMPPAAAPVSPAAATPVPQVAAVTNTRMILVARSSTTATKTPCYNTAFYAYDCFIKGGFLNVASPLSTLYQIYVSFPLAFLFFFLLVRGQSVLRVEPISTVGTKDRKKLCSVRVQQRTTRQYFNFRWQLSLSLFSITYCLSLVSNQYRSPARPCQHVRFSSNLSLVYINFGSTVSSPLDKERLPFLYSFHLVRFQESFHPQLAA
jgi:hypothetical protein